MVARVWHLEPPPRATCGMRVYVVKGLWARSWSAMVGREGSDLAAVGRGTSNSTERSTRSVGSI